MKDVLEVALRVVGDFVQGCVQVRSAENSTPIEKRRLLVVILLGIALGAGVVLIVVKFSA